jgi:ferredoxin-NADP reductase
VAGPRNNFPLAAADGYLFIAGGIGITPILPMLAAARAPWRLVYGGRTRDSMTFLDELARYGDRVTVWPQDQHGLLDLDTLLGAARPGTAVYCCGPEPLLRAVEERCPPETLHVERFCPSTPATPPGDAAFQVELTSSGEVIDVPAGVSVLAAVRAAGIDVLSSCAEGTCGTCETGVLDGVPDHRDSILTPAERESTTDFMMICVSRARTPRLVLDL